MPGYDRIIAKDFGGPEVLVMDHVAALPEPGEGEVRLRVEAAGVGYTDTIVRRGRYPGYTGGLPATLGYDVVGVVDKLGTGVADIALGARVAAMPVSGAYSQYMILPARAVFPVPEGVAPTAAIEVPLMWVTAWQMLTRVAIVATGSPILAVGASGAVGRALVLLGRHLGCQVIGTCSAKNMALVEALGATAIDHRRPDLVTAIRAASGDGVVAAFDAIGGASWDASWQALARGGLLVGYGLQEFLDSGEELSVAGAAMHKLGETLPEEGRQDGTNRRTVFYDIRTRRETHPDDYLADALTLLDFMATGAVLPPAAELLPLDQAMAAHRRIAAGGLQQRLVLQP